MAIPPTSYFSQFEKSPSPIKPTLVTEKIEEEVKDEETIPVTTTTEVVEKPSEENYFSQFETSEQSSISTENNLPLFVSHISKNFFVDRPF